MRMLKLLGIGFWMLSLLWPPMIFSQESEVEGKTAEKAKGPEKKAEVIKLEDMFVTAFYGDAVTITPTRTIIDVDKFVKSGKVGRVEDFLQQMAGIDVLRESVVPNPQQVVLLRGFDDSRYVVAIDGRPVTGPTAGADTFVDWSSLTTEDIEKIEVIRGGASALYENSMGGVINIITKKGTKRDTLVPKVTTKTSYSSFDTFAGRITADGGVGDLTYFFNYGYSDSDGNLRNNQWRSQDYSGRLTYLFPFQGNLTLSAKGSESDQGFPVVNDPSRDDYDPDYPIVREDADSLKKFRNIAFPGGDSYKNKRVNHFDIIYDQPIGKTALKVHLYQTEGDEDAWWYGYNSGLTAFGQQYSGGEPREEKQYGGVAQYRFNLWKDNSLTLGYDHRRMEVENNKDHWRIQAGYFDDHWAVTDELSLNLGLRYVHAREYTYAHTDPGGTESYRHLRYDKEWLPKATLGYRLTPATQVYVSANRDYHIPGC